MRPRIRQTKLLGLALVLALGQCADDSLRATFFPQNTLPLNLVWDNTVSLQPASGNGESDTVTAVIHAGRADSADPNSPAPPATLLLQGVTRLRGTLSYKPEFVQFLRSNPGDFFEQNSDGAQVLYNITAESGPSGPTGRLLIDISAARSTSAVRKGDFVQLVFQGIERTDSAGARIEFEGGFGSVERDGRPITGISYYGGRIRVENSSTR
jgi:hypothetical protein